MKKVILNILILVVFSLVAISVVYFIRGSFEMFPTAEQLGKARIIAGFSSILFILVESTIIWVRKKIEKKP